LLPSTSEKQVPTARLSDAAGIENDFSILNFINDLGGRRLYLPRTWLFGKIQPPTRREKNPLASRKKRVIFARSKADDMTECGLKKQRMFSASRFYDHATAEKIITSNLNYYLPFPNRLFGANTKKTKLASH
jgi:hypothetical protein